MALLEVKNLCVEFAVRTNLNSQGAVKALRDVSFQVGAGERLGIVGESGAGKSVAAFSILNLISKPGYISSGEILFDGKNLAEMTEKQIRNVRGNRICMIFQDPMMTLNPVLTIGTQMIECLRAHRKISKKEAKSIAIDRLAQVKIPSPDKRIDQYPHELSGGMRQRVVIAIALLTEPELLIADEPTTALDVTIQAEIMDLLVSLCEEHKVALILITHDLAVVAEVTQRAVVMYAGRVIEEGPTRDVIDNAYHPYTKGLIAALPQQAQPGGRLNQIRGSMPGLQNTPDGCAFHPRCDFCFAPCQQQVPEEYLAAEVADGQHHRVACHLFNPQYTEQAKQAIELKNKQGGSK
ncbi:ABC transporter ATP-binding protein [Pelagibaculum spongiae]|uniref:ABC-type dipeptide transporter n=1 Tax=Pelagibaculum spongiae TaxID=2080658 RepID=A0A2V1GTA0_9GAMM|nr:ABC transporter ATP-binding protein [Pelagibaculum spongiae]PVZ68828.1 methionine ABC transporter ATP-binding protein [Pelagibaculum spongiae]